MPRKFQPYPPEVKAAIIKAASHALETTRPGNPFKGGGGKWKAAIRAAIGAGYKGSIGGLEQMMRAAKGQTPKAAAAGPKPAMAKPTPKPTAKPAATAADPKAQMMALMDSLMARNEGLEAKVEKAREHLKAALKALE
ncbi:MAG TPA: hypothetical protein VGP72_10545 [Planctomycetota bacterium]|jgi:hypothetical protein